MAASARTQMQRPERPRDGGRDTGQSDNGRHKGRPNGSADRAGANGRQRTPSDRVSARIQLQPSPVHRQHLVLDAGGARVGRGVDERQGRWLACRAEAARRRRRGHRYQWGKDPAQHGEVRAEGKGLASSQAGNAVEGAAARRAASMLERLSSMRPMVLTTSDRSL